MRYVAALLVMMVAISSAMPPLESTEIDYAVATTANVAPAVQGGITADGLKTIVNTVLPNILAVIKEKPLPNMSGKASGYKYTISNINVNKLSMTGSRTDVTNKGVTLTVQGLDVSISLKWKYKKAKFPKIPFGSGKATVSISSSDIGATVLITTQNTAQGVRPKLTLSNVIVNLNKVSVKTKGSLFSWLYNIILKAFQGTLKKTTAEAIRAGFTQAAQVASDSILATMPVLTPVGKFGVMDMTLTGPANHHVNEKMVSIGFNGEVYRKSTGKPGDLTRPAMKFTPSGRMLDLSFNYFVMNSAFRAWRLETGGIKKEFTNDKLPANFPIALTTNAWKDAFPTLQATFPNLPMILSISTTADPYIDAKDSKFRFASEFLLDIKVNQGGTIKPAMKISAAPGGAMSMTVESRNNLPFFLPQLSSVKSGLSLVESKIGDVNLNVAVVGTLMDALMNFIVVPEVNRDLLVGFQLPGIAGLTMTNVKFDPKPNYLVFGSDLKYVPPKKVQDSIDKLTPAPLPETDDDFDD